MLTSDVKILVVDDSDVTRQTLVSYFEEEGYRVFGANNAELAEQKLNEEAFDLILLDIRLPGKDGLTLTRELRANSEIGIILVTGRQDELDRIIGLECGADEYVTKPFNPREILARAKNLIRRVRKSSTANTVASESDNAMLNVGAWSLDTQRRLLIGRNNAMVQLTEGEYQLLHVLVDNAGRTMSRDQLMDRLKHRAWDATDRTIDVLVGRLRKKMGEDKCSLPHIITVHGVGYLYSPGEV